MDTKKKKRRAFVKSVNHNQEASEINLSDFLASVSNESQQTAEFQSLMCDCHACIKAFGLSDSELFGKPLPLSASKMILCQDCGNKRCPKASDHRLECTGSNEPGQAGSVYS